MRTFMLRTSIAAWFVLASVLSTSPARAQVVEQTIRVLEPGGAGVQSPFGPAGQRQFKTGTGRIRGRILGTDAPNPIRRAQVRITGPDIAPKAALTDASGRFDFRELPAGRYTLQASKPGFVSVQYGQNRPFEQGKGIELADKQSIDNADIAMPRGGVISGRVVDEFGDALPDISVTAMRQTWSNGRRRLVPSPGRIAQTNDLGQFRIYGLPPGDYYVSATVRSGLSLGDMEVTMLDGGGIRTGSFVAGPTEPRSGYAATYYPGTANVAEAQKIALAAGQELSGADFGLLPVRLAKVTGIVVGSDGKPLEGAAVTLVPAQRDLAGLLAPTSARSGKDGSFTLNSVPTGEYTLQARALQVFTSTQGDSMMVFRATAIGGPGGADSEFASTPVSVGGEDIANLVVVTSKGGTASGRVIFDGASPASLSAIRVTSVATDSDGPAPGSLGASLKDDGTFELKGLAGPRLLRIAGAPPGWTVKSVKANGIDITDTGAEFKPGEAVSGLDVELTQRTTTVIGTVSAADGSLVKDYTVVVFAESAELWRLPMTRWVNGTRPDQEGRFKFQNLPAGEYYAVAVEYVPMGEWGDPELLDRLRSKAKRFTLADGASQTLDLRLTAF
jgi:hypothetical protein